LNLIAQQFARGVGTERAKFALKRDASGGERIAHKNSKGLASGLNARPLLAGSGCLNFASSFEPHNLAVLAKVKAKIKSPRGNVIEL
jgi:hypothetical protein